MMGSAIVGAVLLGFIEGMGYMLNRYMAQGKQFKMLIEENSFAIRGATSSEYRFSRKAGRRQIFCQIDIMQGQRTTIRRCKYFEFSTK